MKSVSPKINSFITFDLGVIKITMDKLIAEFPDNILKALEIASKSSLVQPKNELRNIVVCGMGGSGIGGKIIGQWFSDQLRIPFTSIQDYKLPAFVDKHSLVIASSYSGNTEETLAAVQKALEVKAHIVAICSGGKLFDLSKRENFDAIVVPGGKPPRAALAYSLVQLVNILIQLKLVNKESMNDFKISADYLEKNSVAIKKEAKEIANFIGEGTPIFYSSSDFEGIAIRARQQLNENAKTLCWHHTIPEMNHNELVGWSGGTPNLRPIFIQNKSIHARNLFRFNVSKDVMKEKCNGVYTFSTIGDTKIQESLYAIHLLDWASWYLSQLKKEDPMAIPVIDYLKGELDKF